MKKMPVKKKVGVKKLENRPKSGREIVFFAREKIEKMAKNGFHGHFFFFTGKNLIRTQVIDAHDLN